jgi:hypothetical protein
LLLFGDLETEFLLTWERKQSGCFDFGRTGLAFNLCDDVILECIVAGVIFASILNMFYELFGE